MKAVEFGSLFEFIRNGMSVRQDKSGEGLPITRIETISEAVVDATRVGYADLKENDCSGWLLQPGDILFSHINSLEHIGKCAIYEGLPEKLVHGMNLLCLRPDKSKLTPQFGKYLIRSNPFRSQLFNYVNKSVNQASVSIGNLKPIVVSLPPLPEQKRIAAILDKADSIRRKRQEAVRLTEELLRSVFLEMFGDPVTNSKGWPVVEFGELCEELRYGTSSMCSSDRQDGDLPVLRIPNVIGGLINWDDMKHVQLPEAEIKRLRLEQGDLLFVRTNGNPEYIGRCAVFDDTRTALYASYLIRARLKKDSMCLSQYAGSCFAFPSYRQRLVAEAKTTAGNFNINTEGLKSLKLPVPPLCSQQKFLTIQNRLATSIVRLQSGVDISGTLFNSLLLRAFRGKL